MCLFFIDSFFFGSKVSLLAAFFLWLPSLTELETKSQSQNRTGQVRKGDAKLVLRNDGIDLILRDHHGNDIETEDRQNQHEIPRCWTDDGRSSHTAGYPACRQ